MGGAEEAGMTTLGSPPADAGTRLALDRTRLAYERTMMAWVRTATSLISFGFTIHKFFQFRVEQGAASPRRLLGPGEFGGLMVAIGLLALILATFEHRQNLQTLRAAYGRIPRSNAATIGALIAGLGVVALVAMMFRL
jgi:putative membrane protein